MSRIDGEMVEPSLEPRTVTPSGQRPDLIPFPMPGWARDTFIGACDGRAMTSSDVNILVFIPRAIRVTLWGASKLTDVIFVRYKQKTDG